MLLRERVEATKELRTRSRVEDHGKLVDFDPTPAAPRGVLALPPAGREEGLPLLDR